MEQHHEDNMALLREGQDVTVGANYHTTVKGYCEAEGMEIPEEDRQIETEEVEARADQTINQIADIRASFETRVQYGAEGNVRAVLLSPWRPATDEDRAEKEVLAITAEAWNVEYQPKIEELAQLKAERDKQVSDWLPQDLQARLIAVSGVGPALADKIIAELTK